MTAPQQQEKRKQDFLALDASRQIASLIEANPNTCFDNAWHTFLLFPDLFQQTGRFIEGWWVIDLPDEVILNEHGWCELEDGTICDPTVVSLLPEEVPVYYYPGVVRRWEEVARLVEEEKWFPYVRFGEFGEDGLLHPAYKAAREAALQRMHALANATTLPKKTTVMSALDFDAGGPDDDFYLLFFVPKDR